MNLPDIHFPALYLLQRSLHEIVQAFFIPVPDIILHSSRLDIQYIIAVSVLDFLISDDFSVIQNDTILQGF